MTARLVVLALAAVCLAGCGAGPQEPPQDKAFKDDLINQGVAPSVPLARAVCTDLGDSMAPAMVAAGVRQDPEKPRYSVRESLIFVRTAARHYCPEVEVVQ